MKSICVYCGSSQSVPEVWFETARSLGRAIASRGVTLVYGGAHVGLMGALADATLELRDIQLNLESRVFLEPSPLDTSIGSKDCKLPFEKIKSFLLPLVS